MSGSSTDDDKQPDPAANDASSSSCFVRAKNYLRMPTNPGSARRRSSPPAVTLTPKARSGKLSSFYARTEVEPEATVLEASEKEESAKTTASSSSQPGDPRDRKSRETVGHSSWTPTPRNRASPNKRKTSRSERATRRRRRKADAKIDSECSSLSDLEEIDVNSEKWKTFGSEYASEQLSCVQTTSNTPDKNTEEVCGSHMWTTRRLRCEGAARDEGSRSLLSEGTRSSSATLSDMIVNLRMVQEPVSETVEQTSTACEHTAPSEQWVSGLAGDLAINELLADGAIPREDDELRDRVASWDPSQENGYALHTPGGTFQLGGLENTAEEPLPASSYNSVVDESLAASQLDCLLLEKTSSKPPTGPNIYQDLQWLSEGSADGPSVSSHSTRVYRPSSTPSSARPSDRPAVIDAIKAATESFVSLGALSRKALSAERSTEHFQQSRGGSEALFAHTAALSDFNGTQQRRRLSPEDSHEALPHVDKAKRQLRASLPAHVNERTDIRSKSYATRRRQGEDPELCGKCCSGVSNGSASGKSPSGSSSSSNLSDR